MSLEMPLSSPPSLRTRQHYGSIEDVHLVHIHTPDILVSPFTNIKADHLIKLLKCCSVSENLRSHWRADAFPPAQKAQESTDTTHYGKANTCNGIEVSPSKHRARFTDFVEQGGTIIWGHITQRGYYTVHIETPDKQGHTFSSVSQTKIKNVPGFELITQE
ncbi:hypothetical protein BASA60_006324 [Batrachochytrium salamandrivorans]|nr:hypothetical protein BASA60_006324 [Batrachochytrium salamandrivorans]